MTAAPVSLDGLGVVGQSTDFAACANDMLLNPSGTSDTDNALLWDGKLATPIRETENGEIEINSGKARNDTWVDGEGLAGATRGETIISFGVSAFPTAP